MSKHHVGVVLASSSLPFWDRHVLLDRTTREDVALCFVPADADAAGIVDMLATAQSKHDSARGRDLGPPRGHQRSSPAR